MFSSAFACATAWLYGCSFKLDAGFGGSGSRTKPWLLVELSGKPWGAKFRLTKVTSTASVLCERKEAGGNHREVKDGANT